MSYSRTGYVGGLVMLTLFAVRCDHEEKSEEQNSFAATLDVHLNAIKTSDLKTLEPTVADDVIMIGPDGTQYESKSVFIDFHKKWFATDNWEWDGEIVRTESSDSLGHAFIKYHFTQKDSLGQTMFEDDEYLILIFRREAEGWQLTHDQNTAIK